MRAGVRLLDPGNRPAPLDLAGGLQGDAWNRAEILGVIVMHLQLHDLIGRRRLGDALQHRGKRVHDPFRPPLDFIIDHATGDPQRHLHRHVGHSFSQQGEGRIKVLDLALQGFGNRFDAVGGALPYLSLTGFIALPAAIVMRRQQGNRMQGGHFKKDLLMRLFVLAKGLGRRADAMESHGDLRLSYGPAPRNAVPRRARRRSPGRLRNQSAAKSAPMRQP